MVDKRSIKEKYRVLPSYGGMHASKLGTSQVMKCPL
jgi:hypothetical protein